MNKPEHCETGGRPWLLGVNETQAMAVYFQPACGLWSCPYCAQVNQARWAVRAFVGVEYFQAQGIETSFLTLTSHEKLGAEASLKVLPHAWSVLGQRARRTAERFEYLMVPEQHQDGRVHMHAIETSGLGQRWWKDNARASGFGFMATEDSIRTASGAAWYVSKYIGKGLEITTWPKGFRRVRTSQQWPKLPENEMPEGWIFKPFVKDDTLNHAVGQLAARGITVHTLDHSTAWRFVDAISNSGEIEKY